MGSSEGAGLWRQACDLAIALVAATLDVFLANCFRPQPDRLWRKRSGFHRGLMHQLMARAQDGHMQSERQDKAQPSYPLAEHPLAEGLHAREENKRI